MQFKCSGVRCKTEFLPLDKYTDGNLLSDFAVLPQGKTKWCELEADACRDVQQTGEHVSV